MESNIVLSKKNGLIDNSKTLSIFSVLFIFLSIIICGYVVAGRKYNFRKSPTDSEKDFSISYTLANGFIPGIIVFIILSCIFIFRLMFIRRSYKYYYLRYVLIFLTVVLVISLIWVTPLNYNEADTYSKDEENKLMMQHGILAFIAFSSVTIFVLLTYRILYVNYKDKVFIGLAFISIISYFVLVSAGLVAFVLGKQEKTIRDGQYVFDAFELINTFLFCVSLLFYGFFGLKSLKKK